MTPEVLLPRIVYVSPSVKTSKLLFQLVWDRVAAKGKGLTTSATRVNKDGSLGRRQN